jgi:NAD(P)-dependent dehydrogenase (short-subunit alcohol dehydrogenase family)
MEFGQRDGAAISAAGRCGDWRAGFHPAHDRVGEGLIAALSFITGTTHGIGRTTAAELARAGHHVVMLCRDAVLAGQVAADIRRQIPGAGVDAITCDLASLDSVRQAAATARERYAAIDRLILNAGVAATSRQRTATGMDLNFAVNHLGHFLLTELLRERMAPHGRIITVASLAHYRGRLDLDAVADPQERILPTSSYGRSKLANVLHSFALARRLAGSTVTANCLHPGIVATHLLPGWVKLILGVVRGQMFDAERGSRTTLHLALSPDLAGRGGLYFDEKAVPVTASRLAQDVALQEALWERSLKWAGLPVPQN